VLRKAANGVASAGVIAGCHHDHWAPRIDGDGVAKVTFNVIELVSLSVARLTGIF